jgi:hypothetical protein
VGLFDVEAILEDELKQITDSDPDDNLAGER